MTQELAGTTTSLLISRHCLGWRLDAGLVFRLRCRAVDPGTYMLTPCLPCHRWVEQEFEMLYPRGSLAVTALGDQVYAIGGFDSKDALNVVEVMDTRTMKWRSLPPLSTERAYGEATVAGGKVCPHRTLHQCWLSCVQHMLQCPTSNGAAAQLLPKACRCCSHAGNSSRTIQVHAKPRGDTLQPCHLTTLPLQRMKPAQAVGSVRLVIALNACRYTWWGVCRAT